MSLGAVKNWPVSTRLKNGLLNCDLYDGDDVLQAWRCHGREYFLRIGYIGAKSVDELADFLFGQRAAFASVPRVTLTEYEFAKAVVALYEEQNAP